MLFIFYSEVPLKKTFSSLSENFKILRNSLHFQKIFTFLNPTECFHVRKILLKPGIVLSLSAISSTKSASALAVSVF